MPSYCYYGQFIIPGLSRPVQRGTLADFMFRVSPILKCSLRAIRQIWVLRSASGCCEKFRMLVKAPFLFSALGANHSMNILQCLLALGEHYSKYFAHFNSSNVGALPCGSVSRVVFALPKLCLICSPFFRVTFYRLLGLTNIFW